MAEVRAPLDEQTLRETREELIDAHTEMQGQLGVPVPSRRSAEELIDPILHKVEREHAEERDRDYLRPDPKPFTPKHLKGGEWYGEPEHSPKVPASVAGEKVTLTQKEVGTVVLDKATGAVRSQDGKPLPKRADPTMQNALSRLIGRALRESWSDPEWRDRWIKLFWFSGLSGSARVEKAMRMVDQWRRDHPDPIVPRDKRIIVGA